MLISIIMPVYNAEKTVSQAISSVLSQNCCEWELIVIDDNSSDNSLKIVKDFAKSDDRIKVFGNSENLGPSATRNFGLEKTRGKYIGFIDADDTIENDFVSIIVSKAENYEAEIVWCNYTSKTNIKNKGVEISNNIPKNSVYSSHCAVSFFFSFNPGIGSVCNKVFLKEFLDKNKLKFNPKRKRAEDWEFNLFAFSKVNRLILIEDYLYNYIQQNNLSIMSTYRDVDYNLIWRSIELLCEINNSFNLNHSLKDIYDLTSIHIIEFFYKSSISRSFKKTKKTFKERRFIEFLNSIDIRKLPITYRILCKLLRYDLWILAILFSRCSNSYHKCSISKCLLLSTLHYI